MVKIRKMVGKDSPAGQTMSEQGSMEPKSCHGATRTSGAANAVRSCCEHGRRTKRVIRTTVACQTDDAGYDNTTTISTTATTSISSSPKKEDSSKKSEGTLRLMIHNFRNMNDTVRGPPKMINGVNWKIMVMPRQHVVQKKGTQKCLGFFLQCCPDSYSDSWQCQSQAELRLISQKQGVPNFIRKTSHIYTAKENDWGYSCFMTWADILEESSGYLKDEKVILEVYVKAEQPKGILTLDGFSKKIADYMRLAEMQSSRGLLDKAIEVNQSALKFCKDKHEETKVQLEAQKATLIEMKLKQSIERIEKGKVGADGTEEAGTNLSTLRQALTGTVPAKNKQANAKTGATTANKTKAAANPQNKTDDNKHNENDAANGDNEEVETIDLTECNDDNGTPVGELVRDLVDVASKCPLGDDDDDFDDEQEACTSDEDDNGSGGSDEICDNCLQEKLENISHQDAKLTDSSCQTEALGLRIPPMGQDSSVMSKNEQFNKLSQQLLKEKEWAQLELNPDTGLMPAKRMSDSAVKLERDTLNLAGNRVPARWTAEKEAELLELITQVRGGKESRASLDSIRDTLERLVTLAQDGDVPEEIALEMAQLRCNERLNVANTDVIELPAAPPEDDACIPPPPPPKSIEKPAPKDDLPFPKGFLGLPPSKKSGKEIKKEEEREPSPPLPMPDPLSEYADPDSLALLKQAKELVENNKADDLVSRYNQIVEQSEAARLAETVKKVEKRMKDIEKQTMTCRKELSDECDRHYKEEQKLIKANKQIKAQLEQANDKAEKINVQLRDRKAEIKRLEKRLKAESQQSAENADLMSKIEQLEKELAGVQKKLNDETKRHARETQHLTDTRKQLQADLQTASSEIERLNAQLDEKANALRKLEHAHEHEKKNAKTSLKEALERAKKAEINLLEFKLEMGLKTLNRAQEECNSNLKQLDEVTKKSGKSVDELRPVLNYIQDWQKTKDKIVDLINKATTEFNSSIESIRSGKPLTLLPALEVPRPPPPPPLPKLSTVPPPQQALTPTEAPKNPLPNPIGARRAGPAAPGTPTPPTGPTRTESMNGPTSHPSAVAPQGAMFLDARQSTAPFGAPAPLPPTNDMSQLQQHSQPIGMGGGDVDGLNNGAGSGLQNGFSPWVDPFAGLGATLFGRRDGMDKAIGLGGLDTWSGVNHSPIRNNTMGNPALANTWSNAPGSTQQQSASLMHQPHNTPSMAPGQWGVGWGYQQVTTAPPAPSPDSMDKNRSTSRGPGGSPIAQQALIDSRSNSPTTMGNERTKRADALMEQLRATFPHVSGDILVDYVNEYRNLQATKTLKGMSVEQALNGVVTLIMSKHKGLSSYRPLEGGSSNLTLDTFVPGSGGADRWTTRGKYNNSSHDDFPELTS